MDGKTIQQIKEALLTRWQKIETNAAKSSEYQNEVNVSSSEMIDIAQSLEQLGRETSLQEVERRELLAIERALAKMATGNFGICEDCGDEIPFKRLLVLPEARLCANCQAFEERQNSRTRLAGASQR